MNPFIPWILTGLLLSAMTASAQEVVSASPDITIDLGASVTTADEDVVVDNQLGIVMLENLGSIPDGSDVIALGLDVNGDRLVAFDTATHLALGQIARPGDVFRYDSVNYSIEFDADVAGVPAGAATDAVSLSSGGLLLSFDTTVDLGGGLVVADEDLVEWNGAGFTLVFDGTAAGLDGALDIDAAQDLGGGALLMSFDTTGQIAGVVFGDEDVMHFDGTNWTMEFDASAADAAWEAADLDAVFVPEPATGILWSFGALGLLGLAEVRHRTRASRRNRDGRSVARHERRRIVYGIRFCARVGSILVLASAAHATDGVLEINQTCAIQTGCFGNDTPGFPVSITDATPGKSFRLTSDLVVTAFSDGIVISSDFVEIDLNGFRIVQAGCESATSMCNSVEGFSDGITIGVGAQESTVRNGSVIGMSGRGIDIGEHGRIENVTVKWSGRDGIRAADNSIIIDNYVLQNGIVNAVGIVVAAGSVVRGNKVVANAYRGIRANGLGSVISGNAVIANGDIGILSFDGNAQIQGNHVRDNGSQGISADEGARISGNMVAGNASDGISAGFGSSVFDNAIFGNVGAGVQAALGTSVQRNSVRENANRGLSLLSGAAYRENRITINTGGNVVGGLNMGDNACDNATTCP